MKPKKPLTRVQIMLLCLFLGSMLLFVSACSGMSNSGSQPGSQPVNNGYSLIHLVDQQIGHFFATPGR